ncbi:MAG: TRAP transporter large permease [Bacillota bacterium]|jgi:C4-dicarboxylate transporter DctM subunit
MGLLVGVFLVLILLNVPIAFALAVAPSVFLILNPGIPLEMITQQMFTGLDIFAYLAVPFFILSGNLMVTGGISRRLVDFSAALLERCVGGLAMAVAFASMIFASISGSGPATVAAIGGATLPSLVEKGYGRNWSVALMSVAGVIGPIIPPSITMVIYGAMTGTSIGSLFIGGLVPGVMIGVGLMIISYFHAKKVGLQASSKLNFRNIKRTFVDAFWALGMPIVILGGILGGIFTPTEAAVVSDVYALVVCFFIYKSLKLKDLPKIFLDTAITTAVVMIILANAAGFAWIMSAEQGPAKIIELLYSISDNKYVLMLMINIILLIIGCFIDTSSALVMVVPALMPLAMKMGIDPLHFGLIICINLVMGMTTPPLGITLFTACSVGKVTISQVAKPMLPMLGVLVVVILIVTYCPSLVLFLPKLLMN